MKRHVIDIQFPGGKRVNAQIGERTIATDQAPEAGGNGEAPEPFELFLASMATCAGIYALGFCQARELSTQGLGLHVAFEPDAAGRRIDKVVFELKLPEGFPEKYVKPILRAIDLCAVKRHIVNPPEFEVRTA